MKLKFMRIISAAVTAAVLFCAVGCSFDTYVKTDEVPETSITGFFDCIKSKDFEKCDQYLANDASFKITNQTGYTLADVVLNTRIDGLSYEITASPVIKGSEASCTVTVTAPNIASIKDAMSEEYNKMTKRYVKENKLTEFPTDDKDIVNQIAIDAFNAVIDQVESVSVGVVVKMSFQDGMWKIVVTDQLCTAILGEVISNEE